MPDAGSSGETPQMPDGEYDLILADPAWEYREGTTDPSREIENHYPTMDLDDIKALDVPAADDCLLLMWATSPKLAEACEVIDAWGFDYRTSAAWDKKQIGPGYWFRCQHELLLVAVKGDFSPPEPADRRSSVFRTEATEHSEKPPEVRRHIEKAYPEARKLELFSRDGRVGWTMWGNETVEHPQQTLENIAGGVEQ